MKKITAILISILLLAVLTVPVGAADAGAIQGQLVNGTAGGTSVANLEVALTTLVNGAAVAAKVTKSDEQGRFEFTGLTIATGYSYGLAVNFEGARYFSEELTFQGDKTTITTQLKVWDSTTNAAAIKISTAHTIVYVKQGTLVFTEFYLVNNAADRTYIGSADVASHGGATMRFALPENAVDIQYGGDLVESGIITSSAGFIDTTPILPGDKQILYSYQVDSQAKEYRYARTIAVATDKYDLLIEGANIDVEGGKLAKVDTVKIGDITFNRVTGTNLVAGDSLVIQLSSQPGIPPAPLWAGVTVIVLAVAISLVYLIRRRKAQHVSVSVSAGVAPSEDELLAEIAALDDKFENGLIAESEYRQLRANRKARLVRLLQHGKEKNGPDE